MAAKKQTSASRQNSGDSANAIGLLKADHRKVTGLFRQFEAASNAEEKRRLAREICTELIVHTRLEEEIFYAACREAQVEDSLLDEAQVEHDGAKLLITGLLQDQPDSPYYDARMAVLREYIKHHVGEEEKPGSGILARARAAKLDMNALGQRLQQRKEQLMQQAQGNDFGSLAPRSLDLDSISFGPQEQSTMARQNDRERDDQGRFMSEDDDRSSGRYSGGRSSGGRSSQDDDYRYSARGGSSENRGRGWYGDSEGHSRASEEGWESRGRSGSSRGDYEDERGRYESRGGYDDRAARSGESRGRGSYESQGRMRDDDERGGQRGSSGERGRGWFGDSEGHARAAEEGWESRGRSRSSRDDDDDDRGGRGRPGGRDQGGWFGDPRGHSEAARRGWQNR